MPSLNYTPIRSRKGRKIHAVMNTGEGVLRTACGRDYGGRQWVVGTSATVSCWRCLTKIGEPVETGGAEA